MPLTEVSLAIKVKKVGMAKKDAEKMIFDGAMSRCSLLHSVVLGWPHALAERMVSSDL